MINWKTTLAGLVAGIPTVVAAIVTAYQAGQFNGESFGEIALGIGMILVGALSKDHDTTGGTPSTPATKA